MSSNTLRDNALVSVIIPVHNGELYLAETLDSVLAQTYRPLEIIIINDGSTDGSADIIQSYKEQQSEIVSIDQPCQGVGNARNAGLAVACGTFIAFLDQDDTWDHNKLQIQMAYLHNNPHIAGCVAQETMFVQPGVQVPDWVRQEWLAKPHTGYLLGTLVIRRGVFDRVGSFNPAYVVAGDADWFARAKDLGEQIAILPDILLYKRVHSTNESQRARLSHRELLEIFRSSVQRQREEYKQ